MTCEKPLSFFRGGFAAFLQARAEHRAERRLARRDATLVACGVTRPPNQRRKTAPANPHSGSSARSCQHAFTSRLPYNENTTTPPSSTSASNLQIPHSIFYIPCSTAPCVDQTVQVAQPSALLKAFQLQFACKKSLGYLACAFFFT